MTLTLVCIGFLFQIAMSPKFCVILVLAVCSVSLASRSQGGNIRKLRKRINVLNNRIGSMCKEVDELHSRLDEIARNAECESLGAKLAEIESSLENDFVKDLATKAGGPTWLGGTDNAMEGTWKWSSSGNLFTFTDWGQSQPDNNGGIENCLHMRRSDNYRWNDANCTACSPCQRSDRTAFGLKKKKTVVARFEKRLEPQG
nr:hypothetical protein BaRGS_009569 [Batillaria attramentaria]